MLSVAGLLIEKNDIWLPDGIMHYLYTLSIH